MTGNLKAIIDDLRKLWNGLDLNQKFTVSALTVVAIVASIFFIVKASEPNWSVLYSDLAEPDVAAIAESLKKTGYAYKISEDKKAILVAADKKEELRMFVAENDLIQDSSPGFELLDDLQLGSTDFKNKLTKQRIFQGELTRSIEKLNGISKARVQLAEPERSVFADEDESPTASVMLILEPGYRIKASQVNAIKNLVAYAIPRLSADKVFLTDQYGNVLSEDVSKNSNDMQSFKSNFEKDSAKKIKETLETIMGKHNVSVQVSAELDFNSTRATIESYTPANANGQGIVVTSQGEKEFYNNPNAAPANVATTTTTDASGQTVTQSTTQDNKNMSYGKERNAVSYAVAKEVKQVVYAPGSVRRMTVAVAVNKILTDSEKKEIENLVAAAAGMDLERGDMINISSLKFTNEVDKQEDTKAQQDSMTYNIIELIFTKIAPLVILLILGLVALNTFATVLKRPEVARSYRDEEEDYGIDPFLALQDAQEIELEEPQENVFNVVVERKKSDITDAIAQDPAEAARLLTTYIRE